MADIFISYSRKDKEFVRRLYEALKRRDREAWVDWQDIRPTEDFMQAIYGAIEGADTFVFVLTPDSVASDVYGYTEPNAVGNAIGSAQFFIRSHDAVNRVYDEAGRSVP
jgi:hypothetical protein